MPLELDDQQHVTAAEGYAALGMFLDANEELEQVDPDVRHVAEVLAVRVEIYRGLAKWDALATVAKKLAEFDPGEFRWWSAWAYGARRSQSVQAAREILMAALEHHPQCAMIRYHLACYECQLGNLEAAKESLAIAFKKAPRLRSEALDDEDLQPLWDELGARHEKPRDTNKRSAN